MYIFSMVQHTVNDGDVIPPSLNFETELEW